MLGSDPKTRLTPEPFILPRSAWCQGSCARGQHLIFQEPNPEARTSGARLIREGTVPERERRTFVFVNNRLEGNALTTIAAMLEQAAAAP